MTKRLHDFLALNGTVYQTFKSLPQHQTYFPLMVRCYLEIGKKIKDGVLQQCPNPLFCKPHSEPKKDCIILESSHKSSYIGNGLTIHKTLKSNLVESQSCYIPEINN